MWFQRSLERTTISPILAAHAAPVLATPADNGAGEMTALGRNIDPTSMLGELDKSAFRRNRLGIAEAGFDDRGTLVVLAPQAGGFAMASSPRVL